MATTKKTPRQKQPESPPIENKSMPKGAADFLPKETQMHLFRAGTEMALALDTLLPKSRIPEEVKEHAMAARKEVLLMIRAMIDANLEGKEKCAPSSAGLKKIEVE